MLSVFKAGIMFDMLYSTCVLSAGFSSPHLTLSVERVMICQATIESKCMDQQLFLFHPMIFLQQDSITDQNSALRLTESIGEDNRNVLMDIVNIVLCYITDGITSL